MFAAGVPRRGRHPVPVVARAVSPRPFRARQNRPPTTAGTGRWAWGTGGHSGTSCTRRSSGTHPRPAPRNGTSEPPAHRSHPLDTPGGRSCAHPRKTAAQPPTARHPTWRNTPATPPSPPFRYGPKHATHRPHPRARRPGRDHRRRPARAAPAARGPGAAARRPPAPPGPHRRLPRRHPAAGGHPRRPSTGPPATPSAQALDLLRAEGLVERLPGVGTVVVAREVPARPRPADGPRGDPARTRHVTNEVRTIGPVPAPAPVAERLRLPTRHRRPLHRTAAPPERPAALPRPHLRPPWTSAPTCSAATWRTPTSSGSWRSLTGQRLGHAEITLEAVNADAHSAAVLEAPRGAAVLMLERLTHLADGRPVDLEFIRFRGDRITMSGLLHRSLLTPAPHRSAPLLETAMPLAPQRADVPVTIDESKCIDGCTLCVDMCPLDSLAINPRQRQGVHARRRVLVLRPVRGPLSHRRRHGQHALSAPLKTAPVRGRTPMKRTAVAARPRRRPPAPRSPPAAADAEAGDGSHGHRHRRLPVQDHQHGHRRHPAALPRLLRGGARPRCGKGRHHLQGRVAGLRHRRADHRPDDRREDRHRLDGRLPAAHQRGPRQAARTGRPAWSRSPATTCAAASTPSSPRPIRSSAR